MGRRRDVRPTPAQEAQIRAVLALDVDREDELIRERALEIAADCARLPRETRVPQLAAELARLVDAFEGFAAGRDPPAGRDGAARVGLDALELAARVDERGRAAD